MWSDWQRLSKHFNPSPEVLAEILDGGQAFRWNYSSETNHWTGQWEEHVVRIRIQKNDTIQWSCASCNVSETRSAIEHYLQLDGEYELMIDTLPWRSDSALASEMKRFEGLRILKQPFGETLMAFICSSSKQIVQIKQMCEALADRFGKTLAGDFKALPSWHTLAEVPEEALRDCKLGYRAKYIQQTARVLAASPNFLIEVEAAPYESAKAMLTTLPGVGEKVADCVLLFGAGKLEAFPVDTWILKVMNHHYALTEWKPHQVAHFGRKHFGTYAGLAQQFLFSGARLRKIS